jgi:hypothetical protein
LIREAADDFDPTTPCPRCTMADTPATRKATKARIGPWAVRQVRNPWAPGMRFETLMALIKRGQVTKDSIVRGPTTHQLWKRASEVKGISREFFVCYSCGAEIDKTASLCPQCNRLQEPPANPDALVETSAAATTLSGREPAPAPATAPAPPPATAFGAASGSKSSPANTPSATSPGPVPPIVPTPRRRETELAPVMSKARPAYPEQARDASKSSDPLASTVSNGARRPAAPRPGTPPEVSEEELRLARQITQRPPARSRKIRPVGPGTDDALLTPQELAAAFQLGIGPSGRSSGGSMTGKRSRWTIAAAALLLAGVGVGALLYLQPGWSHQTADWASQKLTAAKGWISGGVGNTAMKPSSTSGSQPLTTERKAPAPPATVARSAPATQNTMVLAPLPPAIPPHVAGASKAAGQSLAAAKTVATAGKTETVAPKAEVSAPPPAPTRSAAPAPAAAVATEKQTASPAPTPLATPAADPAEQARTLFRKAIDAENEQDYVEAVRCYEQIKKLPVDSRGMGVDVRLEQARKLAQ